MSRLTTNEGSTERRSRIPSAKLIATGAVTLGALSVTALAVTALASPALAAAAQESSGADVEQLSIWSAVILGLVEGFTEYLPVSSTGHLLVTTEILGLAETEASEQALDTYAICIQAGAIAAVFVLYWERIRQMLDGLLGRSEEGRRVLIGVIVAFIPTAIIGLALVDYVRDQLFGVTPIAAAWLVGGIGILLLTRSGLMDRGGLELSELTIKHALIIGVAQAIAMWPGTSRSLVTIVAAVLVGLSLRAAVEFAFLLGLATLGAATVATGFTDGAQLVDLYGYTTPAIGMVVAFFAALISIKWMVSWLQERSFDVFGYYRVVIGVLAFAAIGIGWL
ncbi:MAG: undecaprenyl-diphosphate phosphatase [Acidimicrobiales bacterium]